MKILFAALLISLVKESSVASFRLLPSRDAWLKKGTIAAVGAAMVVLTNPSIGNAESKPANIEKISTEFSENDIWRDTSLRYMGYANEVGESFGVLFPSYIEPSYGVAYGYVCGDALDKVYKSYQQGDEPLVIAKKGADALTWQTLDITFVTTLAASHIHIHPLTHPFHLLTCPLPPRKVLMLLLGKH